MKTKCCALLICALSLLTACELESRFTPSPPPITTTPSIGAGWVEDVTWTSQEDALLLFFYMVDLVRDHRVDVIPSAGTAHLQVSKWLDPDGCVKSRLSTTDEGLKDNRIDGTKCLVFDVEAEVQASDFVFAFKRYVDPGSPRDWSSGWHYWYTFVVPWEAALESYGKETAFVDVWFEQPDGSVVEVWHWETAFSEGRLREPAPFEPPRY